MNRIIIAVMALVMLVTAGCATTSSTGSNRDKFVSFHEMKSDKISGLVYEKNASGIKWNDDYVVTAKHVEFIKGEESQEYDIKFVKMKSNKPQPSFRDHIPGEALTVVGNNGKNGVRSVSGVDSDTAAYVENQQIFIGKGKAQTNQNIEIISVKANPGQSGGPVIGTDGKVVGMLIGDASAYDPNKSFYIPYSVLKQEFDKIK